jgi:uncharacterized delta-60 repeat protein
MRILFYTLLSSTTICSSVFAQFGELDPTFGTHGKTIVGVGRQEDITQDMLIQPDGKILLVGYSDLGAQTMTLIRFNTDGSLDTTFGKKGKSVYIGQTHSHNQKLTLYADGRILVAEDDGQHPVLVRFRNNGIIDSSFGKNGRYDEGDFTPGRFHRSFILKDGTIVAPGSFSTQNSDYDYTLTWITPNGKRDSSKGINGRITQDILNKYDFASDAIMQSNGKVVMGGSIGTYFIKHFHMIRFNQDGSIDSTFGKDGTTLTNVTDSMDWLVNLLQQPDGKILASGYYYIGRKQQPAVVRYTADGILDLTFAKNGIAKIVDTAFDEPLRACAIDSTGRIIIGGSSWDGKNSTMFLGRLKYNGEIDSTYGNYGFQRYDISKQGDGCEALAVQHDGKYVLAGETYVNDTITYDYAVLRVLAEQASSVNNHFHQVADNGLTIYPNPCNDKITVKFINAISGSPTTFTIYDMLGRNLFQSTVSDDNSSAVTIVLPPLPDGSYSIECSNGVSKIIHRLVVLH